MVICVFVYMCVKVYFFFFQKSVCLYVYLCMCLCLQNLNILAGFLIHDADFLPLVLSRRPAFICLLVRGFRGSVFL